ncbi:DH domain-containing protein, partial [Trichostrongylus colubriformis]
MISNESNPCHVNVPTDQLISGRSAMRVGRHTRATLSMDEAAANERPSRKMSADAVSRKSSFAHSRMLQKARQDYRIHSSDDVDSRGSDGSLKDSAMDEPSCSLAIDDGGTRRARSVTSSRIGLFFAKEKEMLNKLNEMKERTEPLSSIIPEIEKHWTDIVADRGSLSRRHVDQQEAIWEIVTTEYRYIQVLKNMHDLSCYFIELQKMGYFKEISAARVFLNYTELFTVNVIFWRRAIQPLLDYSRQTRKPFDPLLLLHGFEDISEWSKCYIPFNLGHDDSHTYVQKKQKDNEMFKEFVQWAESQESMRRQKLCDTLTSPMQRLTRYSLLLKAVLSNSTDDRERLIIQSMFCLFDYYFAICMPLYNH